ncbi:MAG: hypothetical protein IJ583_02130 [Firmicutes bacterium]|nr:hypothetical protein [Bacillota bacterium]
MILGSCINELKMQYPAADTSGFEMVFRLNDGKKDAFVAVTDDGKYPKIFNKEAYPQELLEREVIKILERYVPYDDNDEHERDMLAAEEEAQEHLMRQKRITVLSNIFISIFVLFEIYLIVKAIFML